MEPQVALEENKNSVCRLCAVNLISKNADDVFKMENFQKHKPLNALIKLYLSINIDAQDNMSSVVCSNCSSKLISFDEFATKCNEVQTYLQFLRDEKITIHNSVLQTMKIEYEDDKGQYAGGGIKEEDEISVKSEWASDNFDDVEDITPIAECLSRKHLRKRKTKSISGKYKLSKIKKKRLSTTPTKSYSKRVKDEVDSNSSENRCTLKDQIRINSNNSFFNFVCHICNESFLSWGILKNHCLKKHNVKSKIKCICEKYLFTRKSIRAHLVKHDNSRGLKCDLCDKKFPSRKMLETHSYTHASKEEYPFVCDQCPKKFITAFSLRIHAKTHIPLEERCIFPCYVCGAKFTSKGSVKTHIDAVHEKHRPFVCDICGHAFNSKGNLQDHRLTHSDEKMFTCSICSKKFKTKARLRRHIECHTDTRFKCPQCPATLSTRETLRTHMYIHEDILRYTCTICNKGYKRSKALKTHMNLHTGQRPYSCLWCPRTFVDNSNCRIHKKRKHPIELAEYEALHGLNQDIKNDKCGKVNRNVNAEVESNNTTLAVSDDTQLKQESTVNKII